MVTDKPRRGKRSRRALIASAAGVVGLAAAGTVFGTWAGPSLNLFDAEPADDASRSSDKNRIADDLVDGIELLGKGFSTHPPRSGHHTPLLGMGARLRNTTDKAVWVAATYFPVDDDGYGLRQGDDRASFGFGEIPIPPATEVDSVGIGLLEQSVLTAGDIADVVIQLHHLDFDAKYQSGAHIIQASVTELDYHTGGGDGVDYVTFEADNPGAKVLKADYVAHFRGGDGATIGGWYADRAQWNDLEGQLPDGEDERYPRGDSTHTLPIWLPPDLKPAQVSLYLWARLD